MRRGFIRLQAIVRGRRARKQLQQQEQQNAAAKIQATWKMHKDRQRFIQLRKAAVLTQLRSAAAAAAAAAAVAAAAVANLLLSDCC